VNQVQKKSSREPTDRFQVAIRLESQTTTTGFVLAADFLIERTLSELDGKWKQHPVGHRFFELKTKYPIIPEKGKSSEHVPQDGHSVPPRHRLGVRLLEHFERVSHELLQMNYNTTGAHRADTKQPTERSVKMEIRLLRYEH